MKTKIYIPKRINVGYQERKDTYTGKLAYVIYFDEKGKLRKETSWESWRDENIPNNIYDNEPLEGFVINKNAGGIENSWSRDVRKTYVRVYDPRGFEIEITIPNLLWILECCTSTKGKGLEGEFVYGWDGKDLLLVPTSSPDYQECITYSQMINKRDFLKPSELKIGYLYETRKGEKYIYVGRYNEYLYDRAYEKHGHPDDYDKYTLKYKYSEDYIRYKIESKLQYWFLEMKTNCNGETYYNVLRRTTVNNFISRPLTNLPVDNYAELFANQIESSSTFSQVDFENEELVLLDYDVVEKGLFECIEKSNTGDIVSYFYDFFNGGSYRYYDEQTQKVKSLNLHYHKKAKLFYIQGEYNYFYTDRSKGCTLKEIFKKYPPAKTIIYLSNGKVYKGSRIYI